MGSGYSTETKKTVEREPEVRTPMPDLPPATTEIPADDVPLQAGGPAEEPKSERKRK